jgi:hypothetical protein
LRGAAARLFAIGIRPAKLGFMLAFQTSRGVGGREGLEPASAWFEVAKLQALAAQQVAREVGIAHIWSWGWGTYNEAGRDPDKADAACVWLWARDRSLCDAPSSVPGLDADLRAGQIDLPTGVRCALDAETITTKEIGRLARTTGDAEIALSALYARLVERRAAAVTNGAVLAAERAVVRRRFDGRRVSYVAAVVGARATLADARGMIGDELRRRALQARLVVRAPGLAQLSEFQETYGSVLAREVTVEPSPSWLPGGRGVVLATEAPSELFAIATGGSVLLRTIEGLLTVRALDETTPLAGLPFLQARPALVRALRGAAKIDAYHDWTVRRQETALDRLRCVRDRLPAVGAIELTSFVPFLALDER